MLIKSHQVSSGPADRRENCENTGYRVQPGRRKLGANWALSVRSGPCGLGSELTVFVLDRPLSAAPYSLLLPLLVLSTRQLWRRLTGAWLLPTLEVDPILQTAQRPN